MRVEPSHLQGPRPLADQTKTAAIRDYLDAWESVSSALAQNRPGLLDRDFTGTAKSKLVDTIQQQTAAGITTRYHDTAHDVQIVFYSPEGLSIQLIDKVDYDVEIIAGGKVLSTQKVSTRYVVVMTPAEVRWRVRIFQGEPE